MATTSNPVREAREAKDLSKEQLAVKARISYEYVRRLEAEEPDARPKPGIDIALRLSDVLGVPVQKLFPQHVEQPARAGRR